jgi:hypothetical protein
MTGWPAVGAKYGIFAGMHDATTATGRQGFREPAATPQPSAAWAQGDAYGGALALMTGTTAHDGGERQAGDYLIGYAVAAAEGAYEWVDGELEWRDPVEENIHLRISVRDAGDGRFVPGLRVVATLADPDGAEIGPHEHPLVWHPVLYHYGRNWLVASDGEYILRIEVDPPRFLRQDDVNGLRFMDAVAVEFPCVNIRRGRQRPSATMELTRPRAGRSG